MGVADKAHEPNEVSNNPQKQPNWVLPEGVQPQDESDAAAVHDSGAENDSDAKLSMPMQKRRRVTRACDECRRKKIKCDGKQPCTHCTVYSYGKQVYIVFTSFLKHLTEGSRLHIRSTVQQASESWSTSTRSTRTTSTEGRGCTQVCAARC